MTLAIPIGPPPQRPLHLQDRRGNLLLREPRLLVPRQKPLGSVKVNWEHKLASKLTAYQSFSSNNKVNLVSGNQTTFYKYSAGSYEAVNIKPNGPTMGFTGYSYSGSPCVSRYIENSGDLLIGSTGLTIFGHFYYCPTFASSGDWGRFVVASKSGVFQLALVNQYSGLIAISVITNGATSWWTLDGGWRPACTAFAEAKNYRIVATWNGDSGKVYVYQIADGVALQESGPSSFTVTGALTHASGYSNENVHLSGQKWVGSNIASYSLHYMNNNDCGNGYSSGIASRAWSRAEVVSWMDNPYQFLIPA